MEGNMEESFRRKFRKLYYRLEVARFEWSFSTASFVHDNSAEDFTHSKRHGHMSVFGLRAVRP